MPKLNSSELKKEWLRLAMVDGDQSVKMVLDGAKVGPPEQSGFPQDIYKMFPNGIPLDLLTSMPLGIDYDTDPDAFTISLAFTGHVKTCRIPWKSIAMMAIGIGGVVFEHDTAEEGKILRPRPGLKLV